MQYSCVKCVNKIDIQKGKYDKIWFVLMGSRKFLKQHMVSG